MVGFWHLPKVRSCGPHRTSSICVFVRGLKKRQKMSHDNCLPNCVTIHIIAIFKAPICIFEVKDLYNSYLWYKINIIISHLPSHNISLWCYQMTWSEHNWIIWIYVWQENLNFIIVKQENIICNFIPLFDVVKTFCWNNAHEEQMKSFNWTS